MWEWHWPNEDQSIWFLGLLMLYGIWRTALTGIEEIVKLRNQIQEIDANVEEIYKESLAKRYERKFGGE